MPWLDYMRFRDAFAAAMDPRLYTIEHLDRLILSGEARLWSAADAAIVAEIRTFPTGARALHGLVAAGTLETITGRLIPTAEAWARERGCLLSIIESRPGWARALKPNGYSPHQLAVMKEL